MKNCPNKFNPNIFQHHVVEIGTVCNFCDNNPHKRGWTYEKSMLIKKHVHYFYKIRHERLTIFTKNLKIMMASIFISCLYFYLSLTKNYVMKIRTIHNKVMINNK